MLNTAKVFWSGRSQAVRLPKEFRLNSESVRLRRQGKAIVLEPIETGWAWLDNLHGKLDADVIHAIEEPMMQQKRPELDELFA